MGTVEKLALFLYLIAKLRDYALMTSFLKILSIKKSQCQLGRM